MPSSHPAPDFFPFHNRRRCREAAVRAGKSHFVLLTVPFLHCTVELSFLFGNHFVVSMNWILIKPIAGPQARNDTKRLASTRARRSSKAINCQLQMHIQASTAKDRLKSQEQESESAPFGSQRASYEHRAAAVFLVRERTGEPKPASTRRDKLPIISLHRQKNTPDKPP